MEQAIWSRLPTPVLETLKTRLGEDFTSFANECETLGLVQNNFVQLATKAPPLMRDPGTICSFCASAVVSAANHFGGAGDLARANLLARWALRIEPQHIPAMSCLAAIATYQGDKVALRRLQQEIDSTLETLRALPESKLSPFQMGIVRGIAK